MAFVPLFKEDETTATLSTITVYWHSDPYPQDRIVTGFRLRYREEVWGVDESAYAAFSTGPEVGAGASSATISGLKSSTVYRIELQALADDGNSDFEGASFKFITEGPEGPDQPSWDAEDRDRLFDRILEGEASWVRAMIRKRGFPVFLHNTGSDRLSALHFAAKRDAEVLTAVLQGEGSDTELRCDIDGDTKTRNLESVEVLMESAARIDAQAAEGHTPLHFAVLYDHPSIMEALLQDLYIDPNIKDNDQWTALAHAVELDKTKLVELLLSHADIDISITNDADQTPLAQAQALGGREKIINLLEQHGE